MATVSQRVAFFFRSVMMSRPEIRNLALNLLQNSLVFFFVVVYFVSFEDDEGDKMGRGRGEGEIYIETGCTRIRPRVC